MLSYIKKNSLGKNNASSNAIIHKLQNKLFAETPIYSLVFTRIAFGVLMIFQCCKYIFSSNPNWIYRYYLQPQLFFKYQGFEWVNALPGNGMYWCFYVMLFLAFLITIGAFYRAAIISFTVIFTYTFLINRAHYYNHYYMIILLGILLSFMPANRYCSIDAYLQPKIKSAVINFWPVFLLRCQMEIILIFAGTTKLNYDWLHMMPLQLWFNRGTGNSFVDYFLHLNFAATIGSYGSIILHLVGAPLLLFKSTRIYIFILYCIFHFMNFAIFEIGVFPFMTITLTLIFFDADWPKKIFSKKIFGIKLGIKNNLFHSQENKNFITHSSRTKNIITALILFWVLLQTLIPLRYLLYDGYSLWTKEGYNFSWRLKLADSYGFADYYIKNKESGEVKKVTYGNASPVHCAPDMILQVAHDLHKKWQEKTGVDAEITTYTFCSLNGRKPQMVVDPTVDLAKVNDNFFKAREWVMPFDKSFE